MVELNTIIESNTYGKFSIIKDLGIIDGKRHVLVRFLDTGYEVDSRYDNAIRGKVKDPTRFLFLNKDIIFQSNKYGPYKIIEDMGTKGKNKIVKILFINTGNISKVQYNHALDGAVMDNTKFSNDYIGKILPSQYYGNFEIIDCYYNSAQKIKLVTVKFLLTGFIGTYQLPHALIGSIKDGSYNNAYEAREKIGPISIIDIKSYLIKVYYDMVSRCYDINSRAYKHYGAKGVKVCDRWLNNIDAFIKDAQFIPGWNNKYLDPLMFHLDKDLLQSDINHNEKYYAPNTCIWLPNDLNSIIPSNPELVKIEGDIYYINNIYFIKNYNINGYSLGPFNNYNIAKNISDYYNKNILNIHATNSCLYNANLSKMIDIVSSSTTK